MLGCTHYPLLREVIGAVMGDDVALVDSAEAVAAVACERSGAIRGAGRGEPDRCYVTDAGGAFAEVAERFLGAPIDRLEQVELAQHDAPA